VGVEREYIHTQSNRYFVTKKDNFNGGIEILRTKKRNTELFLIFLRNLMIGNEFLIVFFF